MEELVALSIEFSSLILEHRRGSVGLAKIGIGCFDDVYRKVPPTAEPFGTMSLFRLPTPWTLQELFTDGLQLELYSEKSSLELICAGRVEVVEGIKLISDTSSHVYRRPGINSALKQLSDPIRIKLPLYFKTGKAFSIAAGSVEIEMKVFQVLPENAFKDTACSSCCLLDDPLSNQVILEMPAAQTSVDMTDKSSELSESSEDLESTHCDSDASLDDFVQNFLSQTSAKKKQAPNSTPAAAVVRESVQSVETLQTQLSTLKKKVRDRGGTGQGDADEVSQMKFRRPKKPKVPHYMMPARTPSFQDMLRKR